jgi:hypothetical protein
MMSTYLESDFTSADNGLDYVFGKMGAIYGATFTRNWDGVDLGLVRQTWKEMLGVYATYKPTLDFALSNMDKSFVPSAIAFKDLCSQAGRIPVKPERTITHQPTQAEIEQNAIAKEEAIAKIRQWKAGVKL